MFIYLAAFDITKADAIVRCPACSREIYFDRESIERNNWVAHCCGCGALFGVVPMERFNAYVRSEWHMDKPTGPATYVDFVVRTVDPKRGSFTETRWHGWVDPTTRKVIQAG